MKYYKKKKNNKTLLKCTTPYVNYSGNKIEIIGEYDALISYSGITKNLKVVVSKSNNPLLLGRTFLRAWFRIVTNKFRKY